MVTSLCVPRGTMQKRAFVSIGTDAGSLVILGAVIVGAVVKGAVPLSHRSAPPLVHEVPVEAREGSVLRAFALYKEGTLLDAEFLQVSGMRIHSARHYFRRKSAGSFVVVSRRRRRRRSYMYFSGS